MEYDQGKVVVKKCIFVLKTRGRTPLPPRLVQRR